MGVGTTSPTRMLDINGDVRMLKGSNAINFTSSWSSTPDAPATTVSEISNDTATYYGLMIIGNRSGGVDRRVRIWDRLTVAGGDVSYVLSVTGNIYASGDIIVTNASSSSSASINQFVSCPVPNLNFIIIVLFVF
jgi:hypothetical protein